LLRRSFESDAEAKLVHDLREDGFLTLGLVATDDEGQVVGYVAFSPVPSSMYSPLSQHCNPCHRGPTAACSG